MLTDYKYYLPFVAIIVITYSIYLLRKPTDLNVYRNNIVSYDNLPAAVKSKYNELFVEENWIGRDDNLDCFSISDSVKFDCSYTGIDNGLIVLFLRGHNHHFNINGKRFKLKANKGRPFLYHHDKIYYPKDLMISKLNYNKSEYYEIDLMNKLD